ncbi:hypothetical protein K466DRAFT_98830 [Polyporus arcularius HHB13444]|uniref:Uncharacterized protein n=1 Tax=Polyporus arcularius HHB13444 TaxID=1314778 RepID=A0A5C3PDE1_9APHY|nr:hypothetical protein K466DRAFT_98830 [Polyporus arcularius HHB13444]
MGRISENILITLAVRVVVHIKDSKAYQGWWRHQVLGCFSALNRASRVRMKFSEQNVDEQVWAGDSMYDLPQPQPFTRMPQYCLAGKSRWRMRRPKRPNCRRRTGMRRPILEEAWPRTSSRKRKRRGRRKRETRGRRRDRPSSPKGRRRRRHGRRRNRRAQRRVRRERRRRQHARRERQRLRDRFRHPRSRTLGKRTDKRRRRRLRRRALRRVAMLEVPLHL